MLLLLAAAMAQVANAASINVNFTAGTALSTSSGLGILGYRVRGDFWDNLIGNNGTLGTVHVVSSSGERSVLDGASVTISGTRGYWYCSSLAAASELRAGYIDDDVGNMTPTVTVKGVPFSRYRVIVYHAADSANFKLGYDTINGIDYSGVSGTTAHGTMPWGSTGPSDSANAISEGVNTIVSGILASNDTATVTVTGHGQATATSYTMSVRSGIAAIQVVDATDEVVDVSALSGRFTSSSNNGAWSLPTDAHLSSEDATRAGIVIGTNAVTKAMTDSAWSISATAVASIPQGSQGTLIAFNVANGDDVHDVRAHYNGDGTFFITYDEVAQPDHAAMISCKTDVSGVHAWTLSHDEQIGTRLYKDKMLVANASSIKWHNYKIKTKIAFGGKTDGGDPLSGATMYAAFTDFRNYDASYAQDALNSFDAAIRWEIEKSGYLSGRMEILSHVLQEATGPSGAVVAMDSRQSSGAGMATCWHVPLDATLADGAYVDAAQIVHDAMLDTVAPGLTTNAVCVSVLAELPSGVAGAVAGLTVKNGTSRHYVFAYSNGDGTFSLGYDTTRSHNGNCSERFDLSGSHVWTLAFSANGGARFYKDGDEILRVDGIKWTSPLHSVSEALSIGNDTRNCHPLAGMKVYAVHSDFAPNAATVFNSADECVGAVFDSFDFLDNYSGCDTRTKIEFFDNYLESGVVGMASLNGEVQSAAKSAELIRLFGAEAVSVEGVTFKIDGLDMSNGTLMLGVSPSVTSGNTLSVVGKKALGDRWRRLRVNPQGSTVIVTDSDLADYRFFQLRAELGEKELGYTVRETPIVGDRANTESESHITAANAGGEAVLFSIVLDDGADGDYSAIAYKSISFQLDGVAAGATATLATNGVIAATAVVEEDGTVDFTGLPRLCDGAMLSVGLSTSDVDGNIVTTNFSERAGALAYAWGDGESVAIDGGVTNTMTMLACKPRTDINKGADGGAYRIPAIAKSTNGVIVAIYDCRYNNSGDLPNAIDLAENWSGDNGETWAKPHVAVDVPNSDQQTVGKDTDMGDPCILYDLADDKFWVMGITGGGLSRSHVDNTPISDVVLYTRGTGMDAQWENRRSVKSELLAALVAVGETATADESIKGILQGPGHGIVQRTETPLMPAGALIFPMQYFPVNSNFYDSRTFAAYSKDGGATWQTTKLTDASVVAQENCIMELDDGSWYMVAKGYSRQLFRTTNYVDWKHVGSMSPSCWVQGTCIRIGVAVDGKSRYVACFTVSTSPANRSHLTLHYGRDTTLEAPDGNGVAWDCGSWDIYPEATGGMSYNSLVMLDDSTLGVLFESHGHIYFRKVDVSEILK